MPVTDHAHSPTPEELMAYIDGEGTTASRVAIAAHLATCLACQVLAPEHGRLSAAIGAWEVEAAPASLRAPATSPRVRRFPMHFVSRRPVRLALYAAGVAAVVLVAIAVNERDSRFDSPASAVLLSTEPESQRAPASFGADVAYSQSSVIDQLQNRGSSLLQTDAPGQGAIARPSVIRTATLRIVAKNFAGVRPAVERLVATAGGFIDEMTMTGDVGEARTLRGTLRVPSDRFAAVADQLRGLGRVVEDTQGSKDVTSQLIDLEARLDSARTTERRLTDLLRERTGTLSDVLNVERELARVRLDIERLDAEQTSIGRRVSYATLTIDIAEERTVSVVSPIGAAAAEGLTAARESVEWTLLFLLRVGPALVLWGGVLGAAALLLRRARGLLRMRRPHRRTSTGDVDRDEE